MQEYWIIDPAYQNMEVYTLEDTKYTSLCLLDGEENLTFKSNIFTDLKIEWTQVFQANSQV